MLTTSMEMEQFLMDNNPIMVKVEDMSEEMYSVREDDWVPLLKWEPDEEEILLVWNPLDGDTKPARPTRVQDASVVFVEPNTAYFNGEHNSTIGTSPSYDAVHSSSNWLESNYDFNYHSYGDPSTDYLGQDLAPFNFGGEPVPNEPFVPFESTTAQTSVLNELPFNVEEFLPSSRDLEDLNKQYAQLPVASNEEAIYDEISRECNAIEERHSSSSPESFGSADSHSLADSVEFSPSPPATRKYRRSDVTTVPTRTGGKVSVRKKEQNRAAAMRYREKKRAERQSLYTEAEQLETDNGALKTKVRSLESEIDYLKTLMREVGMRLP
uniref:BZIP domain-containing protein n=1 Tax=Steinernema glaseri TaxID=37863 RepID=A0A1I7Z672_9BILA